MKNIFRKIIHFLFPTVWSQKSVWVGYYNLITEYETPFQGKWSDQKTCRLYETRRSYSPDTDRFTNKNKYHISDVFCMYIEPADITDIRFDNVKIYFNVEKYRTGILEMLPYMGIRPLGGPIGLMFAMRYFYGEKELPLE